ncbi:MAG: hypothetical protein SNJ82_06075 [Gemmataceae bacterium]
MPILRPKRLFVERLEARDCPALTVSLLPTALLISGTPNGDLTIVGQASGKFRITNGAAIVGDFDLNRNLQLNLRSVPGELEINLAGKTIGGNVVINLGTGSTKAGTSIDIFSTGGIGTIAGNVTILGGNSKEFFGLGGQTDSNGTLTPLPVQFAGNVTVSAKTGASGNGDLLQVGAGTKIQGSLTTSQVDQVSIGEQNGALTTVGGNVAITTTGATPGTLVTLYGAFGKSVTVNAAASTTSGFNSFTTNGVAAGVDTTIAGNLSVSFGTAALGNLFEILRAASGETANVNGNVTFTSINRALTPLTDIFDIQGVIDGNLTLDMGSGDNDVTFGKAGYVGGNLTIRAQGGGINQLTLDGVVGSGSSLSGNVFITLGNGVNTVDVNSDAIQGKLTYRGGNGTNNLTLNPPTATTFNVDFLFGTGVNTLDLSSAFTTLTGVVRGSGGVNTFNQSGATLLPTLQFIRFPV